MKLINKSLLFLFLAIGTLLFAKELPQIPEGPTPPVTAETGVGGTGGASPIDMYIYVLSMVAFLVIFYVAKKQQSKIA